MTTSQTLRTAATRLQSDEGTSLIEAVVATALLLIMMAGLMSVGTVAMTITENQGHLAARTTEYAQDKMEQLLALAYDDSTSDTRLFPSPIAGGTGLAIGGSSNTNAPVAGYVDFLDQSGNLLTATGATPPAGWFYERAWAVAPTASANLKQITVTVVVAWGFGKAAPPTSTVVALKTFPF